MFDHVMKLILLLANCKYPRHISMAASAEINAVRVASHGSRLREAGVATTAKQTDLPLQPTMTKQGMEGSCC